MNSLELRHTWKTFWESKGHALAKPASLIVNSSDDPTTMFNTAWMQPLVPYLMGKEHPTGSDMVYNIQWCVRTVDIEEVGDLSHLTYFEMMGNWSLWSYFKKEAITRSRELLTQHLKLDPEMLSVTVFEWDNDAPLDSEAQALWAEIGLDSSRITPLDKNENRWWPAGATGPCGPDTEIFYRVGPGKPTKDSNPWNDEDNWIEIWNNVFMGYYKDDKGAVTEMERKNVDTGMWFERMLMVLKGQQLKKEGKIDALDTLSVYDIDIFQSLLAKLSLYTAEPYDVVFSADTDLNKLMLNSFRIIADHLKTSLMLVSEGLSPSNEWRGYVLRRIMRRCYYHFKKISFEDTNWSDETLLRSKITDICTGLQEFYPSLKKNFDQDIQTIVDEMTQFEAALQRGGKKIDELLTSHDGTKFSWASAFLLYDTYGVPVELTQEIVAQQWFTVDMKEYDKTMEQAKEQSRAWASQKFAKGINRADYIEWLPETRFIGYQETACTESTLLKDFEVQWTRYLVFDCSPFYAESWGQKWDCWTVELDSGETVAIVDVQKYGGVWLHKVW